MGHQSHHREREREQGPSVTTRAEHPRTSSSPGRPSPRPSPHRGLFGFPTPAHHPPCLFGDTPRTPSPHAATRVLGDVQLMKVTSQSCQLLQGEVLQAFPAKGLSRSAQQPTQRRPKNKEPTDAQLCKGVDDVGRSQNCRSRTPKG